MATSRNRVFPLRLVPGTRVFPDGAEAPILYMGHLFVLTAAVSLDAMHRFTGKPHDPAMAQLVDAIAAPTAEAPSHAWTIIGSAAGISAERARNRFGGL